MSCAPSNSELVSIPCDFVASSTALNVFTVICGLGLAAAVIYGIGVTRRRRTPLYFALLLAGTTCVFIEPLGDIVGGLWIPREAPVRLFTLLDRPMPLVDILVWAMMGAGFYIAYNMMQRGASVRRLIVFATVLGITELAVEIGMAQTHAWVYYSNYAMFLGVPVSTIAQNIGITLVGGTATCMLVPHLRGWRWLVLPFFVPGVMLGYAFATTWPSYIGIHSYNDISPLVGWLLGLVAAALNLVVAYAALHVEPIAKLRATQNESRLLAGETASPIPLAERVAGF